MDDEQFNISSMRLLLNSLGVSSDYAMNGPDAVEWIIKRKQASLENGCECQKTNYSIVFMDINMPQMNGVECTQKIRQLINKQEIEETYIVQFSSYNDEKTITRSLEAGADYYATKPIKLNKLKEILELAQIM